MLWGERPCAPGTRAAVRRQGPLSLNYGSALRRGAPGVGQNLPILNLLPLFFFFFLLEQTKVWFSCPTVLNGVVVLDQGLVDGLGSLTAGEKEMINGTLDITHPIS